LPSRKELPTTSGNIAIGNLQGDVENAEKLLEKSPGNAELMLRVIPIFLMHGKTLGVLRDYDRALVLAESAVKLQPKSPMAWATMAQVHSTLHRFPEALADLKRIEALGIKGTQLEMTRASILQAMGRYKEARPIIERLSTAAPRIDTIGALATLDADEGRIADAERNFQAALASFQEVSPFPLVWLWMQQGLMWQKEGRVARARQLFAAANERLPEDVAVASHLAAIEAVTGAREQAIARLRPIVASSDDPEYLGQLSQLLRDSGGAQEADRLRAQAATRYDELVKRHPAAFAEHAARFWLGPGADAKKAVPLAALNLGHRKTPDAYALVLESRLGAGEPAAVTCKLAESALAPPATATPRLRVLASRAFLACGQKERAEAELRTVSASASTTAPAPPK
jgi:tetratricopeptide (TPR) repeat protein